MPKRKLRAKTKPWKHQKRAVRYFMDRSYGALYTKPGTGKTKIMVDLIVNKGYKRVLIIAPKKVCDVWVQQFGIHTHSRNVSAIDVSSMAGAKKVPAILEHATQMKSASQVVVVNYDSVWREPLKKFLLKKYKADAVICDESHRIKTPGSKCSRMLNLLGRNTPERYLMTGTPIDQSPLDIYAQYRFLNSDIFGTRFNDFKHEYANWIQRDGYQMLVKKDPYKNLDQLRDKMMSCAFMAEVDLDLPPTRDILVEFDMPAKSEKFYKQMQKDKIVELRSGECEAANVLTMITRLQQISSGYLPNEDGDVEEIDTARKDTFRELLSGFPPDEPVIVFCKYRKDIYNARKAVHELGRKSSELSGKRDTMRNWINGKTSVLVIQISSGAEGLNELVKARYCVYYTMTHSKLLYEQSRKRLDRPGQTRSVTYYTLVSRMKKGRTIDQQILSSIQEGRNLVSKIMSSKQI